MKVLVTGGEGFIGSHLIEALQARGDKAISYDLKSGQSIMDSESLEGMMAGVSCVVHLAALAGVRQSIVDPNRYLRTNILGTHKVLDACASAGVPKIIFASSSSVYGGNEQAPFREIDLIEGCLSPYATSKLAGEHLCRNYHELEGISAACLRFFTVIGPRQRPDLAVAKFARMIARGEEITVFGDGTSERDYTYVGDIVDGIIASIEKDLRFEVINLGKGSPIELNHMIECIEDALGKKAKIRREPLKRGEPERTWASIAKAQHLLGYDPKVRFREGVFRQLRGVQSSPATGWRLDRETLP